MAILTPEEMDLLKRLGMNVEDVQKKLQKQKGKKKSTKVQVAQIHEYNLIRVESCNLCKTVQQKYYWMRKYFGERQTAPCLYAQEVPQQIIQDNGLKVKTEKVKYPTCDHCTEELQHWEKTDIIKELLRRKNGR